jgi:hypothetical protein
MKASQLIGARHPPTSSPDERVHRHGAAAPEPRAHLVGAAQPGRRYRPRHSDRGRRDDDRYGNAPVHVILHLWIEEGNRPLPTREA